MKVGRFEVWEVERTISSRARGFSSHRLPRLRSGKSVMLTVIRWLLQKQMQGAG